MYLSDIPQCTAQNRNVPISVLNGAPRDVAPPSPGPPLVVSSYEVNNKSLCSSNTFNVKLWIYGFMWTSYEKASRSIVQMSCQSVAPPVSAMHDSIQALAEGSVPTVSEV